MSDAYIGENALVSEASSLYSRGLDVVISFSILTFTLGLLSLVEIADLTARGGALGGFLFTMSLVVGGGVGLVALFSYTNVIPITSDRVRGAGFGLVFLLVLLTAAGYGTGLSLATILGGGLILQAVGIAAAGIVSRLELTGTEPSMSAGLLAGGIFAALGLCLGGALGTTLFSGPSWIAAAVVGGGGLAALTIFPREDIGSTMPTAIILGVLGATIASAMLSVGWQWDPESLSGGFTGGVVIPIFVIFGSLLSAWAAAKSRANFGARGRQYGAFFVINLNAFLMVSVMVSIVVFVVNQGIAYAFHGFRIGALTALVLLTPLLVVTAQRARAPAGTDDWHSAARQFFRALPLSAVGGLAALLVSVLVTRSALAYEYAYQVQNQERELVGLDTAFSVTPSLTVGNLMLIVTGTLLFVYFYRRYGSLREVGTEYERLGIVRKALPLTFGGLFLLSLAFVFLGSAPLGIPVGALLGQALVVLAALGALGLAVAPVVAFLRVGDGSLAERAQQNAQVAVLGVFGGLTVLLAAILTEWTAVTNPAFGPVTLVPTVAVVGAVSSLAVAGLASSARRSVTEPLPRRLLAEEVRLGLAGAAGFFALVGLHVAATSSSDFTLGPIAVSITGSLSWPMFLQPYIPLGIEPGGIFPAVVGTVWLVVGASSFAVPLGLGAAVFLTEYAEQGKFTGLVEVATNALWSTPSVVFGLFGAAFLIPRLGNKLSLISGMLVLGFMLLPLVLITSREAIKSVPDEYRDASAALGVNRWTTIRSVVIPAAMPGVITGVILGVGRIAGETAPLILVLGSTLNSTSAVDVLGGFELLTRPPFVINEALVESSASLPTQVWAVIAAGVSGSPSMGWGTAFILLMVVLTFYAVGIVARTYFRRKLNHE
jgi:phosphate transport system permease protein